MWGLEEDIEQSAFIYDLCIYVYEISRDRRNFAIF